MFWGPNTNTNIIRVPKNDWIRIRILFGLKKSPEYEYKYYSVWKNHPNTNTNIIRFEKITRIRIRIFWYSNIIRIIFEYRIIRSPLSHLKVLSMGRAVSRARSARRRTGNARHVRTKRASSLVFQMNHTFHVQSIVERHFFVSVPSSSSVST